MNDATSSSTKPRFPQWLKKRVPAGGCGEQVRSLLKELRLTTVCQSARCPNACECFATGTATFMILGDRCTRNCRFCAVPHGELPPPEPTEPERVAEAAARLKLTHVVVTSVTRDDLPDGGAEHFRKTIAALRQRTACSVEVLTPDFRGDLDAVALIAGEQPEVFNHNLETVARLYADVRPDADYARSLGLLRHVKSLAPEIFTKSGLMVGLGETAQEIAHAMGHLREAGCDLLTVGQYLQPTPQHHPIARFVTPEEFTKLERLGREMGFVAVVCGPFVRSSWHAGELLACARQERKMQ